MQISANNYPYLILLAEYVNLCNSTGYIFSNQNSGQPYNKLAKHRLNSIIRENKLNLLREDMVQMVKLNTQLQYFKALVTSKRVRLLPITVLIMLALLMPLTSATVSDAQDSSQQVHVVQSGENLFRIALRYSLTVDQIAAANGITDPTQIYAGQSLVIPGATVTAPAPAPEQPAPSNEQPSAVPAPTTDAATYHIVQNGQTLAAIGRQYGVSWTDIAAWNNISNPNQIFAGQRLIVSNTGAPDTAVAPAVPSEPTTSEPAPADPQPAPEQPVAASQGSYTVRGGDSLASIARQYNISWTTIASANNIANPNQIFVGQVLTIPGADASQGTYLNPTGGVPSAPAPTISTGKQIVVDVGDQSIYAYENGELLRSVIVSTGLWDTPTVLGDYRIYWKLTSQTMSGPGYYLPGVPWVMYFYQGYAIHGTYWHNNFGQRMSHGCVNLPTDQAEWFFRWAEVGTPVHVQA